MVSFLQSWLPTTIVVNSQSEAMRKIAISKFKATCLVVLDRVRKTEKPIQITRFGKPVAKVFPPSLPSRPDDWIGSMSSTGHVVGDVVSPAVDEADWETLCP